MQTTSRQGHGLTAHKAPCLWLLYHTWFLMGSTPLAGVLRDQALILGAHQRLQRLGREAMPVPMRQLLRARRAQCCISSREQSGSLERLTQTPCSTDRAGDTRHAFRKCALTWKPSQRHSAVWNTVPTSTTECVASRSLEADYSTRYAVRRPYPSCLVVPKLMPAMVVLRHQDCWDMYELDGLYHMTRVSHACRQFSETCAGSSKSAPENG